MCTEVGRELSDPHRHYGASPAVSQMNGQTGTIVFWGAGATAGLGMRTTVQEAKFIYSLATGEGSSSSKSRSLLERVTEALGEAAESWAQALVDLLTILGDGDEKYPTSVFGPEAMDAMRRNWSDGATDDDIRNRILALRMLYDWPALKAVIKVCPVQGGTNPPGGNFLNDLFNILDMRGQSGHGFRAESNDFLTPVRVTGARNALKLVILALFYVDWQVLRGDADKREVVQQHYGFAQAVGRRLQRQGLERAARPFDSWDFYMGDVSFASLNYDPIALWLQTAANRNLNRSPSVPHVGVPARRLQIFHDLGYIVPSTRISERNPGTIWHPMNEASAQRLNDPDHGAADVIRIYKFLYPHGCLNWRECPDCGKLSSYLGNSWDTDSAVLFPPPPLKAFVKGVEFPHYGNEEEIRASARGEVDARACVNCKTLTFAHHTPLMMQSNFKGAPPPFIEDINRSLRVLVQQSGHIVFMGYSLPRDDVEYRAFFAARRRRLPDRGAVRCSVVVGTMGERRWLGPSALSDVRIAARMGTAERTTLKAAQDLFGADNVRFYGGGIPEVFLEGGTVTDAAVERLLDWSRT